MRSRNRADDDPRVIEPVTLLGCVTCRLRFTVAVRFVTCGVPTRRVKCGVPPLRAVKCGAPLPPRGAKCGAATWGAACTTGAARAGAATAPFFGGSAPALVGIARALASNAAIRQPENFGMMQCPPQSSPRPRGASLNVARPHSFAGIRMTCALIGVLVIDHEHSAIIRSASNFLPCAIHWIAQRSPMPLHENQRSTAA